MFQDQCVRSNLKWIAEGNNPVNITITLQSRNNIDKQVPKFVKMTDLYYMIDLIY